MKPKAILSTQVPSSVENSGLDIMYSYFKCSLFEDSDILCLYNISTGTAYHIFTKNGMKTLNLGKWTTSLFKCDT